MMQWMDKMGESQKAGNKGFPGTPRDGAPVEITGLLYSTLRWAESLAKKGKLPAKGVKTDGARHSSDPELSRADESSPAAKEISYGAWADLIKKSFELCYYVPADEKEWPKYRIDGSLVRQRGIYKDVYGSLASLLTVIST